MNWFWKKKKQENILCKNKANFKVIEVEKEVKYYSGKVTVILKSGEKRVYILSVVIPYLQPHQSNLITGESYNHYSDKIDKEFIGVINYEPNEIYYVHFPNLNEMIYGSFCSTLNYIDENKVRHEIRLEDIFEFECENVFSHNEIIKYKKLEKI